MREPSGLTPVEASCANSHSAALSPVVPRHDWNFEWCIFAPRRRREGLERGPKLFARESLVTLDEVLHALCSPPGACLSRRPAANRRAILYQFHLTRSADYRLRARQLRRGPVKCRRHARRGSEPPLRPSALDRRHLRLSCGGCARLCALQRRKRRGGLARSVRGRSPDCACGGKTMAPEAVAGQPGFTGLHAGLLGAPARARKLRSTVMHPQRDPRRQHRPLRNAGTDVNHAERSLGREPHTSQMGHKRPSDRLRNTAACKPKAEEGSVADAGDLAAPDFKLNLEF
jgi:hypothetical protein